jgi:tetratricopeptide (TPR) repeat protein
MDKDAPQAEAFLRKAIALDPQFDEAYFHLGKSLLRQGRHEEATDQLRRAIQLDPYYSEAHHELARQYALEERGMNNNQDGVGADE